MNFKELGNGQILLERYPNEWFAYDMKYHTELYYDSGVVIVRYFDYLNNTIDYSGTIKFERDGLTETVQAINGAAEFEVIVVPGETVNVRTVNEGIRNGELTIIG